MTYSVATRFNQQTWDKFGLNWLRKAKLEKMRGFILGDLSEEAKLKISDFGFSCFPDNSKIGEICQERCLFVQYDMPIPKDVSFGDVACSIEKTSALEVVWPIRSLINRAKAANLVQNRIEKVYNGTLSSKYILGSSEFWRSFSGFQDYLLQQDYADYLNYDFLLNLHLSFFKSFRIAIDKR
jgi:hypothetical protein